MKELKIHINKIHRIPSDILEEFFLYWHKKKVNKNEILTRAGYIERYLYFTVAGVQRAYYIKDGKEYNIAFTHPFSFTCIPESFLTQKYSKYTFQSLTESELLYISYSDFFNFIRKHPIMETLLNKTLTNILEGIVNRYHRIITLTMEEKFKDFMKNNSGLINIISHKHIANYLNIDPTNFSKLLNKVRI